MPAHPLTENLLHPPVLFFMLGLFAIAVRSNLQIPGQIGKFLSLYLLFDIGFKGGVELFHSGFTPMVLQVIGVCMAFSFGMPFVSYQILKRKLDNPNAAAIAATYGSISAVTFATAISFLESHQQPFSGFMVAGMALMESPAIVAGLLLYQWHRRQEAANQKNANQESVKKGEPSVSLKSVLHEAFFNGSVLLLVGSLVIGLLCGNAGEKELQPFVGPIFKGMLSLYMLDMGLLAVRRFGDLKQSGVFLTLFGIFYPVLASLLGIGTSLLLHLSPGDALLLTILVASASYIAVPAAMRHSIPKANLSLLLPMALGITFTFNVVIGIPLYFYLIKLANGIH